MKRLLILALCMSLAIGLFAACTGSDDQAADKGQEPAAPSEQTQESKPEPVKLHFFQYGPEYTDAMNKMANEYNKANPNVSIEFEINQDQYSTILKTKLNSGTLPDAFWIGGLSDTKLYADFAYDLTNEPFMKNVLPSALTQVTENGKILGYPLFMQSYSLIYNKKLFADAGITELPSTLSQLKEVCEKLKAKGIPAFANAYKEWWVFKHIMSNFIAAEEGDYAKTAADISSGAKKLQDLKYMNNFFDLIDMTIEYGLPKPLQCDANTEVSDFANGKAAMMTGQGNWSEASILKIDPNFQMGFIGQPVGDDPSKARIMADMGVAWMVTKDGKNVKDVLAWLDWMTNSEYGKSFAPKECKSIGVLKDSPPAEAQLCKETTEFLKNNATYPWIQAYWPNGFDQKWGEDVQAYIGKAKTRDAVLNDANSSWQKLAENQ